MGYINEENFEKALSLCANNPNYKVAILVNNEEDIIMCVEEINRIHKRLPIPYLEHMTCERPWLHYYPIAKVEFSHGSSINILHPSSLTGERERYHTILTRPEISDEYSSRFIKVYERELMFNITQPHWTHTEFAKYAFGEWTDTEYKVATISVDEENDTNALDDFLNEFKIVSKK